MHQENIAKRTIEDVDLENGFHVLLFQNQEDSSWIFEKPVNSSYLQMHFCIQGSSQFLFNNNAYAFDVYENKCILLYNPQRELPIHLDVRPKSTLFSLLISIDKFHGLFSSEADAIPFLSEDNKNRKYYDDSEIKESVVFIIKQIMSTTLRGINRDLYIKGKIYELLSLHFAKDENQEGEFCPYLVDEQHVKKIRRAKEIIIERMIDPPSLQELANEVGLNLKKLKEVFKQIYGDTVYGFLLNYKMEKAKKLLESNQYNVNEVGLKIGYSTSSHFIAAFKKKFDITPKKYLMSL